jgi:hypothetical protein
MKLPNSLIRPDVKMSPYEFFYGSNPDWLPHLHTFGEIAIAKKPNNIQSKLKNCGFPAIYVGPSVDHKEDVCNFWNPKIHHLIQSCKPIFLHVKYNDLYKIDKLLIAHQIAAFHEELDKMFDSDIDTNPVDNEGNNILQPEHHLIKVPEKI